MSISRDHEDKKGRQFCSSIAGVLHSSGLGSGNDCFSVVVRAVGNFVKISGMLAVIGIGSQAKRRVRPAGGLRTANGRIGQLPNLVKLGFFPVLV